MRRSTLLWFAVIAGVVTGLYLVKNRVHALEGALGEVTREIAENRAAIHVLRGEWSHLNRPSRLEDLGRRLLDLAPIEPAQVVTIGELDGRLAERRDDEAVAAKPRPASRLPDTRWLSAILSELERDR